VAAAVEAAEAVAEEVEAVVSNHQVAVEVSAVVVAADAASAVDEDVEETVVEDAVASEAA